MTRALTPATLAEALEHLAGDPDLVPIAGCTDWMVTTPEARADVPAVLDLLGVGELSGVREIDGGGIEIGATTTFHELRHSPLVVRRYPGLAAAAAVVGGWQIQSRATIGGNVVNASPAGDSLPMLLVLGAEAVVASREGERRLPYDDFHLGYRRTALLPGELLVALRLPPPAAGTRQLYRKVGTREAQAISKVVVAATGRLADGRVAELRVAAGSVAPVPLRLTTVEDGVVGRRLDGALADEAGRLAAAAVEPIDDVRSTADYRRYVLGRVIRRMMLELASSGESSPS